MATKQYECNDNYAFTFTCLYVPYLNEMSYNVHVASMDTKVDKEAVSDAKKSHYSTPMSRWVAFKQMCLINNDNKDDVGDMISGML